MNDIRTKLPECPLEYDIPHIPTSHTALVIEINADDIDWQERMLPWTLASLINNTDLIMKGIQFHVICRDGTEDRIRTAIKGIDFPTHPFRLPVNLEISSVLPLFGEHGSGYDSVCVFDINYWAFRAVNKAQNTADIKLPFGHVLRHTYGWAAVDYGIHIANEIAVKNNWIRVPEPLHLQGGFSTENKEALANHLIEESMFTTWLHDANTAVYGEDYKKRDKNIAAYFFNQNEPNWHLDASILKYSPSDVTNPHFHDWAETWENYFTRDALIALYLFKTQQHAHNLSDAVMIESNYCRAEYPRFCNMQFANAEQFSSAIKELMGAQFSIST